MRLGGRVAGAGTGRGERPRWLADMCNICTGCQGGSGLQALCAMWAAQGGEGVRRPARGRKRRSWRKRT